MVSASTAAAKKRLNRLIDQYGDELVTLSPRQRDRVMDAAWTGGKPTARELLAEYRTRIREAHVKAAATRLMNRRHSAAQKVVSTMGSRIRSHRQFQTNAPMLSMDQVREIEKKDGASLADFVERQARRKPAKGMRNPLWYR